MLHKLVLRNASKYQRDNQKSYIKKEQTMRWPQEKEQTTQWPHEKEQTIRWPQEKRTQYDVHKKKNRQYDGHKKQNRQYDGLKKKDKKTNTGLESTAQKTKDCEPCTPLNRGWAHVL